MNSQTPNEHGTPTNDPDDLLEEVARVAREDEMADSDHLERLKKLAAGELSQSELAALQAEAETSDELARDLEAFSPLGEEFRERVLRRLRDERAVVAIDRERPRRPLPRRQIRPVHRAWPALAAAAAVVALLGLWLFRQVATPFQYPGYSIGLAGAIQEVRGDETPPDGLPEFGPGSILRLTMTPDVEPERRPQFTFYFADADGELFEWDRFSQDGAAVRLEAKLGEDLDLTPGVWTVHFVYGEPGELPHPAMSTDLDEESDAWQDVRTRFRVVADDSASAELPLEVLYAGCSEVAPGPVCAPGGSDVTLWIRSAPGAEISVRVGDRPAEPAAHIDGGRRYVVAAHSEDGEIVVTAKLAPRSRDFTLRLVPSALPPWLVDARRRLFAGETEGLRDELEPRWREATDDVRGWLAWVMAFLPAMPRDEKRIFLETAVRTHRQNRELKEWYWSLGTLLHTYVDTREFGEMRRRLEAEPPPGDDFPFESQYFVAFYRGYLESAVGNHRGAVAAWQRAADLATRVGHGGFSAFALSQLAETLHLLGHHRQADDLLVRATSAPEFSGYSACGQANVLSTLAWLRLLSESELGDPTSALARIQSLLDGADCGASVRLNLYLKQALARTQRGESSEARRALADFEASLDEATTKNLLWWHEIEGRVDLAEGYADQAAEHFRQMESLAVSAFVPRGRWRAKVLEAEAHVALGDDDDALSAYEGAEDVLEAHSLEVPVDAGLSEFFADRQSAARRHIELLLRLGRHDEAFVVARRSRNRELRRLRSGHRLAHLSPDQQLAWDRNVARYRELRRQVESQRPDDWRLTAGERQAATTLRQEAETEARRALDQAFRHAGEAPRLPPMRAGELTLLFHPLTDGWAAFGALDGEVTVGRVDLPPDSLPAKTLSDADALSRHLLEPFRRQIESSDSIRILSFGDLQRVDFHALPWRGDEDGDVLLAARPVIYGLDFLVESPEAPTGTRHSLVVGDPRLDLPAARREARSVAELLAQNPDLDVQQLEGRDADRDTLLEALATADHLHFSGHGVGGRGDEWDSSLRLAGSERLPLGDVLALAHAPAEVVLSSCETAGAADATSTLGLAQAFLVAGTEVVVASLGPVDDLETESFFRRVYQSQVSTADGRLDLAQRVRSAQLAWRDEEPAADWARFRILQP